MQNPILDDVPWYSIESHFDRRELEVSVMTS